MVLREKGELQVNRVRLVSLASLVWMVLEVPRETQGLLDKLVMMAEWEELALLDPLVLLVQWLKEKRCWDLLDLLVLMGHLECLEILDLKEKWEPEETWDQGDPPVKTDFKGHLDYRASRAE